MTSALSGSGTIGASSGGLVGALGGATDTSATYSEQVYTYFEIGYLLATNPFGIHYDILRLEIDDVVVYDTATGTKSQVGFRFYDGTQTSPDPIVVKYVKVNPGANFGDILLFLPVAEYDSPPKVRAVLSSSAALNTTDNYKFMPQLAPVPEEFNPIQAAYDPQAGLIYQFHYASDWTPDEVDMLVAINVVTRGEIWRVAWQGKTDPYHMVALPGTGCMVCTAHTDGTFTSYTVSLVDAQTGAVLATAVPSGGKAAYDIFFRNIVSATQVRPGVFLAFGNYDNITSATDTNSAVIVFDVNASTIEIIDSKEAIDWTTVCPGRRKTGSSSFFYAAFKFGVGYFHSSTVREMVWDGGVLSVIDQYAFTDGTLIDDVAYDPQTGYLVLTTFTTPNFYNVFVINPKDGSVVKKVPVSQRMESIANGFNEPKRIYAKPGHVLLVSDSTHKIYDFDCSSFVLTLWGDNFSSDEFRSIYDQTREMWFYDDFDTDGNQQWVQVRTALVDAQHIPLQTALTQIMSLAGYTSDQLVFDGFDDSIELLGYVIGQDSNTKSLLQSLSEVYDFSHCDGGDAYYFKKIAKTGTITTDGTVDNDAMVEKASGAATVQDRADLQTISKMDFKYVSKENGWQANNVSDARPKAYFSVTKSIRESSLDLPLVNNDALMQQLVTEKMHQAITGGRNLAFATVPDFAHFLPGDSITVQVLDQEYTTQITDLTLGDDLSVTIGAIDISADVTSDVVTVSNTPFEKLLPPGLSTLYTHLDLPLLDYADDDGGAALVEYSLLSPIGQSGWTGASLYAGETATDLPLQYTQVPIVAVIGSATTVLAAPAMDFLRDDVNSVTLSLVSLTTLSDAVESEVLLGANMCALGQAGRWEIFGFETAGLNPDGTYTLSNFTYRGARGTEVFEGQHQVGDRFVLLDRAYVRALLAPLADLGGSRLYKAVPIGSTGTDVPAKSFAVTGTAERPYAPVTLGAVIVGSDINLTWDYRSRLSAWEFFSASPDSGEATLSFEIDIMSGSTVLRTLTAATNAKTYLAANITTDFGSMPATLKFRVYMISAVVGRGYRSEATITL